MYVTITNAGNCNGVMVAEQPNPIVPQEVLREVWHFKRVEGLSDADVIDRLRTRTVPTGYPIHNWRKGTVNVCARDCVQYH